MEKIKLDKQTIRKLIKGDETRKGISNTTAGGCCGAIVIALSLFMFIIEPVMGAVFLAIGCFILYLTVKSDNIVKDAEKLTYYLKTDTCTTKTTKTESFDSDETTHYYLHFADYGKLHLNFPYINFVLNKLSAEVIYNSAQAGDRFYLLCSSKNKVIYVFSEKDWELVESEFVKDGNIYRPKVLHRPDVEF